MQVVREPGECLSWGNALVRVQPKKDNDPGGYDGQCSKLTLLKRDVILCILITTLETTFASFLEGEGNVKIEIFTVLKHTFYLLFFLHMFLNAVLKLFILNLF